jgi:hypothetical protein
MDDWWSEIDCDVLRTLEGGGAVAPADVGQRLGLSEDAATSLLCALASQGKIRIRLVELVT